MTKEITIREENATIRIVLPFSYLNMDFVASKCVLEMIPGEAIEFADKLLRRSVDTFRRQQNARDAAEALVEIRKPVVLPDGISVADRIVEQAANSRLVVE